MTIDERLDAAGFEEEAYGDAVTIEGYDGACVGYSDDGRLVYSYERMIAIEMEDGATREEAEDYLHYNVLSSYLSTGSRHPVIFYTV